MCGGAKRAPDRETGSRVGDFDTAFLAVQISGDPVLLVRLSGPLVHGLSRVGVTGLPRARPAAVFHGVRARFTERDRQVVGDVRIDPRCLHGAEEKTTGERNARSFAPQME
ncbi:hypothetical protein GCM10020227_38280 [Streptomyces flavovirens]